MARTTIFCMLSLLAPLAVAATLHGAVVGISDGDTLTVLDGRNAQYKIRLAGIDAPEKSQAFGSRSRQSLADLTFRQQVVVEWTTRDRYGRIVGKVLLDGRDINLSQISAGMAWHYKAYELDQTPGDRSAYAAAEVEARQARRGLWRDAHPTPPWEFRQR